MRDNQRILSLACLSFSIALLSCQAQMDMAIVQSNAIIPPHASEQSTPATPTHRIQFKVKPEVFRIACARCQAKFVRLEIRGPSFIETPIFAQGADDNGFIPVDSEQLTLSAIVPEGSNWTAQLHWQSNADNTQAPLLSMGAVFHVPSTAEEIEITQRALQTAKLVDALHELNAPQVLNPLDLEAYQAFTDKVLGVERQEDGSYTLGDLALDEPLDHRSLAQMLAANPLTEVNAELAETLDTSALQILPEVTGSYRAQSMTAGLTSLVLNPQTNALFSFDILQSTKRFYRLDPTSDGFEEGFTPFDLGRVQNIYLSLGQTRSGEQSVPVMYVMEYTGVNRMQIKAMSQVSGALVWSYNFNQVNALETRFVPMALPLSGENTDLVITTLLGDDYNYPGSRGVYALKNGSLQWKAPYAKEFTSSGAFSPDGQNFYLITRSDPFTPAELVAFKSFPSGGTGELAWENPVNLEYEVFDTTTPVIGSDGTIYVMTIDTSNQQPFQALPGYLQAYTPEGELKWKHYLPVTGFLPPVIDRQNGQDVIYLLSEGAKLHAIGEDGQTKWITSIPGTIGEGPVGSPLVASDNQGNRVIYSPFGNGLIYAVRDEGDRGNLLWAQAPGGKVRSGMTLKDNYLYAPTLDGGEGQWVQVKAIRVHTPNLSAEAPWPIRGGNFLGNGTSQLYSAD